MTKYCPACGEQLIDEARFCKNCGAELNGPQTNVNTHQQNTRQFIESSEKSHTLAIIAGYVMAILIPLIGLIISVYLLTRDSSNAKKVFIPWDQAMELLGAPDTLQRVLKLNFYKSEDDLIEKLFSEE